MDANESYGFKFDMIKTLTFTPWVEVGNKITNNEQRALMATQSRTQSLDCPAAWEIEWTIISPCLWWHRWTYACSKSSWQTKIAIIEICVKNSGLLAGARSNYNFHIESHGECTALFYNIQKPTSRNKQHQEYMSTDRIFYIPDPWSLVCCSHQQ